MASAPSPIHAYAPPGRFTVADFHARAVGLSILFEQRFRAGPVKTKKYHVSAVSAILRCFRRFCQFFSMFILNKRTKAAIGTRKNPRGLMRFYYTH